MKILITGASGFIGSVLLKEASRVYGPENTIAFSSRSSIGCETILYEDGNLSLSANDRARLESVDVLIHLGAFIPKNQNQFNLINECNSNIFFTEKLLAFPYRDLKKIIYISTTDVYEPSELITETTKTIPISLYGWSKLYCESMTTTFAVSRNIDCQILRVGHVYGPGEGNYTKFIPRAINNILKGDAVELWGNGTEIRSFIYIDDVVAAILEAVNLDRHVGTINVVGGVPVSMRDVLNTLIKISGKIVNVIEKDHVGFKRNYAYDNAKFRKYLLSREMDLYVGLANEYASMEKSL